MAGAACGSTRGPDLLYALLFRRQEGLRWRDYLGPYLRRKVFAVWAANDPRPAFAEWRHTVREARQWISQPGQREALRRRVLPAPFSLPE
jgi:hypothetical protein